MTLEEAIERLREEQVDSLRGLVTTLPDALQLGIEALQRVETLRQHGHLHGGRPLPSETKEH